MARSFEDLTSGALRRSEDAFVQWARTGKLAAGDLFGFIEEELLRIAYRAFVLKPFLGPLEEAFTGFAEGLFRSGGPFTGVDDAVTQVAHSGGVIGGPNAFRPRAAPAALFEDAPRLHRGGALGPGEVPIVGMRGEVVGWPEQLRRAFGSETIVQIVDQRGAGAPPIETSRGRGADGREAIRVLVRSELGLAADEGALDKPMRRNFGVARQPVTIRS
jgi:hypothetical protein